MIDILENIKVLLRRNQCYRWYWIYRRNNILYNKMVDPFYAKGNGEGVCCTEEGKDKRVVISIHDGKYTTGGLTDRLRGIVSTYMVCKQLDVPFRIHFVSPFNLTDYLLPNDYDWRIATEDVVFDSEVAEHLVIDVLDDTRYQMMKVHELTWKRIKGMRKRQLHFYSNNHSCYAFGNYSELFKELFKPSPLLQNAIDEQKKYLGDDYVSVVLRFRSLLADFKDHPESDVLQKEEQAELMERCYNKIEEMHETVLQGKKILVASDSIRFLAHVRNLDYVYVIPGRVIHTDYFAEHDFNNQSYIKSFVDMFTIADSKKVYLLKTGKMFASGFPYAASLLKKKPFKMIDF